MNAARRLRKRLRRQGLLADIPREPEDGFEHRPVAVAGEAPVPHYTVQAGLASGQGSVKPDEKKG